MSDTNRKEQEEIGIADLAITCRNSLQFTGNLDGPDDLGDLGRTWGKTCLMPDGRCFVFCWGRTEVNKRKRDERYRIESSVGHVGVGRLLWHIVCQGFNSIGTDFPSAYFGGLFLLFAFCSDCIGGGCVGKFNFIAVAGARITIYTYKIEPLGPPGSLQGDILLLY